jgi:hypothetical protein
MSDAPLDPGAATVPRHATTDLRLALLLEVAGDRKAELVDGEVHVMGPTDAAARCAENIYLSLRAHERTGRGRARGDNHTFLHTFLVDLPGRKSFGPDASSTRGASAGRRAVDGPPDFAAGVRSAGDDGKHMEAKLARKRDDYFASTSCSCSAGRRARGRAARPLR